MSTNKTYKIIISGGGTGGHVFPAIAIANGLREVLSSVEILFVGAKGKLEMTKVPEAGYRIIGLNISGFQRSLSIQNLLFPFKLIISLIRSFFIIGRFKPDVAIGVGGYASGPLLFAAAKKGVPTVLQEQNSYPGITNKMLAKHAQKICVAYDGLDKFFESSKIVKTGNPVRKEICYGAMDQIAAKEHFGFERDRSLILVIGGSLGARTLNDSMFNGLDKIKDESLQLLWQCGKLYFDEFDGKLNKEKYTNVQLTKFITEMDKAYAAADLIISRAGALSISELCLIGKPVILVPSPNVAEDHQTKNAMALVENNAAMMVGDADARENLVIDAIKLIRNKNKMAELGNNIQAMAFPNATEQIVAEIINIIKR